MPNDARPAATRSLFSASGSERSSDSGSCGQLARRSSRSPSPFSSGATIHDDHLEVGLGGGSEARRDGRAARTSRDRRRRRCSSDSARKSHGNAIGSTSAGFCSITAPSRSRATRSSSTTARRALRVLVGGGVARAREIEIEVDRDEEHDRHQEDHGHHLEQRETGADEVSPLACGSLRGNRGIALLRSLRARVGLGAAPAACRRLIAVSDRAGLPPPSGLRRRRRCCWPCAAACDCAIASSVGARLRVEREGGARDAALAEAFVPGDAHVDPAQRRDARRYRCRRRAGSAPEHAAAPAPRSPPSRERASPSRLPVLAASSGTSIEKGATSTEILKPSASLLVLAERRRHARLESRSRSRRARVGEQRRLDAPPRLAFVLQSLDAARAERDVRDPEDRDRREHFEQREPIATQTKLRSRVASRRRAATSMRLGSQPARAVIAHSASTIRTASASGSTSMRTTLLAVRVADQDRRGVGGAVGVDAQLDATLVGEAAVELDAEDRGWSLGAVHAAELAGDRHELVGTSSGGGTRSSLLPRPARRFGGRRFALGVGRRRPLDPVFAAIDFDHDPVHATRSSPRAAARTRSRARDPAPRRARRASRRGRCWAAPSRR